MTSTAGFPPRTITKGWITSERARATRATVAARFRAILTGIGNGAGRRLRLTDARVWRAAGRCCASCGFPTAAALRFQNGYRRRRQCGGRGHLAASLERARRSKRAASACLVFDGPGGRADLQSVAAGSGGNAVSSLTSRQAVR